MKIIKTYITITLSILVIALTFNIFFYSSKMIISGAGGIAIMTNYLFKINPSIFILGFHLFALILGYIFLNYKTVNKSIYGSIIYPLFIFLTSKTSDYIESINIPNEHFLIFIIFGAILSGLAMGLLYKRGYTIGGSDILVQIINKYTGKTIGVGSFILNSAILLCGGFILGFDKVLYAIMIIYIMTTTQDMVMLGFYSNKLVYINTKKPELLKSSIVDKFNIEVTEIKSTGGYSKEDHIMLMCFVKNNLYTELKELTQKLDENAHFVVTHAHEFERIEV